MFMNESKFKKYCHDYIRYSAILEHLKCTDASWGQRREVVRKLDELKNCMSRELDH